MLLRAPAGRGNGLVVPQKHAEPARDMAYLAQTRHPAAKFHARSQGRHAVDIPELYYVSPEWDDRRQLTRHVLVVNYLDGPPNAMRVRPGESGPPITAIRRLGLADADFLAAFRATFAVSAKAWEALRDLIEPTVAVSPVIITRECSTTSFAFPRLTAEPPDTRLLLHARKNIPWRHCQQGYWCPNRVTYDMSLGEANGAAPEATKLPWLDPDEFRSLHLFQIAGDWVASAAFVERVKQCRLSGLEFRAIKYEPRPRPVIVPPKRILPPPPAPDFVAGAAGWSKQLGEQWQQLWSWTLAALKNRRWPARKPKIQPPVPPSTLEAFQKTHALELPIDFANVLGDFSAGVSFDLGTVPPHHEAHPAWEDFQLQLPLMFGGKQVLWDFKRLGSVWRDCQSFLNDPDYDPEYLATFADKLPIVEIGNGDFIAVDLKTAQMVYLSHEDSDRQAHGRVVADNFTDFITRWSWTCLVWPDYMPEEPFFKSGKLAEPSAELTLWHDWLRGAPLPPQAGSDS